MHRPPHDPSSNHPHPGQQVRRGWRSASSRKTNPDRQVLKSRK